MSQYEKPPIGVRPSWYVIPARIKELADGISRYTGHERIGTDKEVTQMIRGWACEVMCQCDMLDLLQGLQKQPLTMLQEPH